MPCSSSRYRLRTISQLAKRMKNSGTMLKIHTATSALAIASARNSCGMLQPSSRCRAMPATAAATMNSAFWMFMPAITRASSARGVRLWISANSGTTKKPVNRPMPVRSTITRQLPAASMNSPTDMPVASAPDGRAKYRSSMNALTPNAPSGTRPISTVRPDSFSHSSEPTPTPIENSASAKMYSDAVPPRFTSAYTGNCAVRTVPMNQNQDTPSTALRTASWRRVSCQMRHDCLTMLKSTRSPGSPASTRGMRRATTLPATASSTIESAAT